MIRFWKNNELIDAIASPARGNGDPVFFVDEVTKFASVESLRKRVHGRVENSSILTHFPPLLTTFRAMGQQNKNANLRLLELSLKFAFSHEVLFPCMDHR